MSFLGMSAEKNARVSVCILTIVWTNVNVTQDLQGHCGIVKIF